MLAAQALNRGLALVSKDMAFDQVRGIVRLW
jgi:predicted nucleic acid-binding protein